MQHENRAVAAVAEASSASTAATKVRSRSVSNALLQLLVLLTAWTLAVGNIILTSWGHWKKRRFTTHFQPRTNKHRHNISLLGLSFNCHFVSVPALMSKRIFWTKITSFQAAWYKSCKRRRRSILSIQVPLSHRRTRLLNITIPHLAPSPPPRPLPRSRR